MSPLKAYIVTRLRSYSLWLSVASFLFLVLQYYNIVVVEAVWTEYVNLFLGFLVAAGILNNPTTQAKGFLDDKPGVNSK